MKFSRHSQITLNRLVPFSHVVHALFAWDVCKREAWGVQGSSTRFAISAIKPSINREPVPNIQACPFIDCPLSICWRLRCEATMAPGQAPFVHLKKQIPANVLEGTLAHRLHS